MMFLKCQNSILEWFVKDHVTLKTEVMAAENSVCQSHNHKNKLHLKHTQIQNS